MFLKQGTYRSYIMYIGSSMQMKILEKWRGVIQICNYKVQPILTFNLEKKNFIFLTT